MDNWITEFGMEDSLYWMDWLPMAENVGHVGITGKGGLGKSTSINSLRGLTHLDEGAASVGNLTETQSVDPYPHPHYPFVLWDLPTVDTPNFPRQTYLKRIGFHKYDYLLVLTRTRITESDIWLAKEAGVHNKRVLFVRTKIDEDLQNDKDGFPFTYNEAKSLQKIRSACEGQVQKADLACQVFIISGRMKNVSKWDFPELRMKLEELAVMKCQAMVVAIPSKAKEVIEQRHKALRKRINIFMCHVPMLLGPTVTSTTKRLVNEVYLFKKWMNLDTVCLQKLSDIHDIPVKQLQACIYSALPAQYIDDPAEVIINELLRVDSLIRAARIIPIFGTILGVIILYTTVYKMLIRILNGMRKAALNVLDKILIHQSLCKT